MKVNLMFRNRDFDPQIKLPQNTDELLCDLELETILQAMCRGDKLLYEVAKPALLTSLVNSKEIIYRQQVLQDCINQPKAIREIYVIAVEAVSRERRIYRTSFSRASGILRRSIEVLEMFTELLGRLRKNIDENAAAFLSEGLRNLAEMIKTNLDDEYFAIIEKHLKLLKFKEGILMSAQLGAGCKGAGYILHAPRALKRSWKERVGITPKSSYSFEVSPRDEAGHQALSELVDRGLNLAANALAQSCDHILSFFSMLAIEIGFYVSCLNLYEQLVSKGEPVCMPVPLEQGRRELSFESLYDVSLALQSESSVVGNTANANGKSLVIITGANSGGKSTFLRSIGISHLMMQCGMFVGARSFRADLCDGIFTHFIREEDPSMTSGKLVEELDRMSRIADLLRSGSMVLFNESFAATNEREGSEIARQIVTALVDVGIKVLFVTHLFTFADGFYRQGAGTAMFLRAEREEDGRRMFSLVEGEPLSSSFGVDLYERMGGFRGLGG